MPAAVRDLDRQAKSGPRSPRSPGRQASPPSAPFQPRRGWTAAAARRMRPTSGAGQGARELVQRVVPADVLPQRQTVRVSGVQNAAAWTAWVAAFSVCAGGMAVMASWIMAGSEHRARRHGRGGADRRRQAVQAAQAAAARAGQAALPLGQRLQAVDRRGPCGTRCRPAPHDVERQDVAGSIDDALGQAEADRRNLPGRRGWPASPRGCERL